VAFHHNQWWLEDLGSTNGIFIGKSRVLVPTVLITDEQFQCGNTVFTVEMNAANEKLDL
jgi:pSer/pThr/pTyr-binding forkhead associated (FHA) protein